MIKRIFKWLFAIALVLLLVAGVFLINAVYFRPWFLNVFYEKVFIEFVFDNPELLSTIGLVEQFGITGHNAKLNDESPAHQKKSFERLHRDVEQLHSYPTGKQTKSQQQKAKEAK